MKSPILPIVAIVSLGAAGMGVSGLKDTVQPPVPPAGLDAQETHGSTSLLGQFRTSASSWLWLRADLYLHNGVEMRQLTEGELKAGQQGVGTSDQIIGDEAKEVTAIPTKDRDFRGIFGDVERAVSAYKDMKMHQHNDPEQSLPLFRLMTWLDPQFVTGWQVGGAIIARDKGDKTATKALNFLSDGLDNNPDSIVLRTEIARLRITRQKDLEGAIDVLKSALQKAFKNTDHLTENDKESLNDAFRWLALCYRDTGKFRLARSTALAGLQIFKDDQVLVHLTEVAPSIFSEEGAKHWLKDSSGNLDEEEVFRSNVLDEHDDHGHQGQDHD